MDVYNKLKEFVNLAKLIIKINPHEDDSIKGKSNNRYSKIFLTGGATALVKIFSVFINLITVPLTLNYLGSERYGLWMSISTIISLLSFADLGLGNGLVNAVAKAYGRKSIDEAKIAVASTFYLLLGIALFLFVVFSIISPFVNWDIIFNVKSKLAIEESYSTIYVLIVILLISMPLGIVQRIQEGYQEGYRFQLWLILGSLISFALLLISIELKAGLNWLVLSISAGPVFSTILNGISIFRTRHKTLIPLLSNFDKKIGYNLIKSGLIFFVLGLFTLIGNSSDNIILAHTNGAESVAGYEIVKKMFLFAMFTQYLIQPLWPAFSEAMEAGDLLWVKKTIKRGLMLSILIGVITTVPLVIFGKFIVEKWVGVEYIPSWSLLIGYFIFILIANYGGVMSTFLNGSKLISKQILMIGLAAGFSILLKIYFSKNYGISGIIWGTVLSYSIFYIVPSYNLVFKHLNKKDVSAN